MLKYSFNGSSCTNYLEGNDQKVNENKKTKSFFINTSNIKQSIGLFLIKVFKEVSQVHRNTNLIVSDNVISKQGCTQTVLQNCAFKVHF